MNSNFVFVLTVENTESVPKSPMALTEIILLKIRMIFEVVQMYLDRVVTSQADLTTAS